MRSRPLARKKRAAQSHLDAANQREKEKGKNSEEGERIYDGAGESQTDSRTRFPSSMPAGSDPRLGSVRNTLRGAFPRDGRGFSAL